MRNDSPLNLMVSYPRSPKQKLGEYVHLSRMVDKARSKLAGMIGEYIFPCPLDQALLDFLRMSEAEFTFVVDGKNDLEIITWINQAPEAASLKEIRRWNKTFLKRVPIDEEGKRRFSRKRTRIAPSRLDVNTWVDLLDLEEGREVPHRND